MRNIPILIYVATLCISNFLNLEISEPTFGEISCFLVAVRTLTVVYFGQFEEIADMKIIAEIFGVDDTRYAYALESGHWSD